MSTIAGRFTTYQGRLANIAGNSVLRVLASDAISPSAPAITSVVAGDGSLSVTFFAGTDANLLGHQVLWGTSSENYTNMRDLSGAESSNGSFTLSQLINDTEVFLVVVSVDRSGNKTSSSESSGTPSEASLPTEALYVVGNKTALSAGETAIQNRLVSKGYTVTLRNSSESAPSAAPYDLLVVSSSVATADMAKYADFPLPIVTYKVSDALATMNIISYTESGGGLNRTQMRITNDTHPITQGYAIDDLPTIYNTGSILNHFYPTNSGVTRLANNQNYASTWSFLAAEEGDDAPTGTYPARRVVLFFDNTGAANLTSVGWGFFDKSVDWATGLI